MADGDKDKGKYSGADVPHALEGQVSANGPMAYLAAVPYPPPAARAGGNRAPMTMMPSLAGTGRVIAAYEG